MEMPKGPFCQSCGMPMTKPDDFGTDERGFYVNDYCHYCQKDGEFTQPNISQEQMTEKVAGMMAEKMGIPLDQAKKTAEDFIPNLKRWSGRCCGHC